MVVKPQYFKGFAEGEAVAEPASPDLTLLCICGKGMVFRSKKGYEEGTCLAVGMFLEKIRGDLGIAEHCYTLNGDHFLNLKGVIADCEIVEPALLDQPYQVTLMFEQLGEGDRTLLRAIEKERTSGHPVKKPAPQTANATAVGLN